MGITAQPAAPPETGWVSVAEAASVSGVSSQAILKAIKSGRISAEQFARDAKRMQWMIRVVDLETFVATRGAAHVDPSLPVSVLVDTANTALHALESERAESRSLRSTVEQLERVVVQLAVERDRQVTLALDLVQQLDAARADAQRLRRAQEALLGAHAALLGAEMPLPMSS